MHWKQASILGPGLLGASLLKAARERGLFERAHVWSRSETTRLKANAQPWCDQVFDTPESCVAGADLLVVCTPVSTIPGLLERVRPAMADNILITDVGSTKGQIVKEAEAALGEHASRFVGSHPMAGSEKTGLENARADLFENRVCLVTPGARTNPATTEAIAALWLALGMRVQTLPADEHDIRIARISHLPHLLASALCVAVAEEETNDLTLAGPGFADTTRIAAGDPDLWRDIFIENREALLQALERFEGTTHTFREALVNEDVKTITEFLKRGKKLRQGLPDAHD